MLSQLPSLSTFAIALLLFFPEAPRTVEGMATTTAPKRVLVTGGNKGIGLAICKKLLEDHSDVHVILGSRDAGRGEVAIKSLSQIAPNRIELAIIDTSNDDSVKAAATSICGSQDRQLYGIINNAGIGFGNSFKDTINTNYFGPRRVCDAFEPFLTRPGGRVVNIASASGPNFVSRCEDQDLVDKLSQPMKFQDEGGIAKVDELASSYYSLTDYGNEAYGVSKALLNAFTVLYAAQKSDLIVNSCSPGYILTDMTRGMGASNSPEKGTVAPIHLLLSEEMKNFPTGRYYGSDAVRSPLGFYRGPGEPAYEGP